MRKSKSRRWQLTTDDEINAEFRVIRFLQERRIINERKKPLKDCTGKRIVRNNYLI